MLLGVVGSFVDDETNESASANRNSSQPRPTATKRPGSASNVSSSTYRAEIVSQSDELGRSMGRFSMLSQDPQFFSDTWKLGVATELAIWTTAYREARAMAAPEGFEAFHRKYVSALSKFDSAADKVARGIDNIDPDLIDDASDDMTEGTRLIEEALVVFPD